MELSLRLPPSDGRPLVHERLKVITFVLVVFALVVTCIVGASPASAANTSTGTVVAAESSPYGEVLVVGAGPFAGYTLYEFSRNTPAACSTTIITVAPGMSLSCAGSETDKTADWPILTTKGTPIAGMGVSRRLLGTVYRKDIGADQVTYGGELLYMFDPKPHLMSGVNYMETALPLPPWHGLWRLVSSKNGSPAVGPIPVTTELLPNGSNVLAADMFQGVGATAITVYTYSKDKRGHSSCSGACALMWPPVLTTAPPQTIGALPTGDMSTIKRSDGTEQLAYRDKPLYFYSEEVPRLDPATGNPLDPATVGTGNGLSGPSHFSGTFSIVSAPAS